MGKLSPGYFYFCTTFPPQKNNHRLFFSILYPYICHRFGSAISMYRNSGLKGNRVKIPNSPAAVKLYLNFLKITQYH